MHRPHRCAGRPPQVQAARAPHPSVRACSRVAAVRDHVTAAARCGCGPLARALGLGAPRRHAPGGAGFRRLGRSAVVGDPARRDRRLVRGLRTPATGRRRIGRSVAGALCLVHRGGAGGLRGRSCGLDQRGALVVAIDRCAAAGRELAVRRGLRRTGGAHRFGMSSGIGIVARRFGTLGSHSAPGAVSTAALTTCISDRLARDAVRRRAWSWRWVQSIGV